MTTVDQINEKLYTPGITARVILINEELSIQLYEEFTTMYSSKLMEAKEGRIIKYHGIPVYRSEDVDGIAVY